MLGAVLSKTLCKTLCAILLVLTAPAMATAQAEGGDTGGNSGDGAELPAWARARIELANGDRFTPDGIVFNTNGAADNALRLGYYIDLGEPAETRNEDKVDLGGIPLLGKLGLGQETTSSEFRGAKPVGGVFRFGNNLLVNPLPGTDGERLATRVRTTIVANQGQSFLIDMKAEKLDNQIPLLGDLPLLGELFKIGDAHRKDRTLLILVTPHMINLDD